MCIFLQVRIWLLSIPLAKIPPFLVATMPISNTVSASELRSWHNTVHRKLQERDLHTLSYNTDGANIERNVSRSIQADAVSARQTHEWSFPHPIANHPPLIFRAIRTDCGKPQIIINDGKHWRKNARNAAQSGARILTLGRYAVHIGQLVQIVESHNSPLLKTDILGVDKQDDRAAARLMSASVIEHLAESQPEELGLIIYLFIMGELIDAQQNRTLGHIERIHMLFRGHFFLDGWRAYITTHPFYTINTHFISYPLYDVLTIYINAMIMLILAHRDFFPDIPLLPWLHSTETCEHFFGCARKIKQDFTFAEFVLMAPKLSVLISAESQSRSASIQANSSGGRFGYYHTWHDSKGVDPIKLCHFPTDIEISSTMRTAHSEAASLLSVLGMCTTALPNTVDTDAFHDSLLSLSDPYSDDNDAGTSSDDEQYPTLGSQLAGALSIDAGEPDDVRSNSLDKKMTQLGIAATATRIHDFCHM